MIKASAPLGEDTREPLVLNQTSKGVSVLLAAAIALMPKCPLCCAAYMSFLGGLGMVSFAHSRWTVPVMWMLLVINVFLQGFAARKARCYGPLTLSAFGTASILLGSLWCSSGALSWIGVALIFSSLALSLITKGRKRARC